MTVSFSGSVKDELLVRMADVLNPATDTGEATEDPAALTREAVYRTLGFLLIAGARFTGGHLRYRTTRWPLATMLKDALTSRYGAPPETVTVRTRGRRHHLLMKDDAAMAKLLEVLKELAGFEPALGRIRREADALDETDRRALLRALFLGHGSMATPERAYQLELVVRRRSVARLAMAVMAGENLDPQHHVKDAKSYLYIKSGDRVARFLALIGAQQALLRFESIRVERELRGRVNRQVNFDRANIRKVAETAARQLDEIRRIRAAQRFDELPQDLQATAIARERYPDYTLEELGHILDPPIGKSGVRHRLRRITRFAEALDD